MTSTTTTTITTLPLGNISADKLAKAAAKLGDTAWQADNKYAMMMALNAKPPTFGFFIKEDDLQTSGWYGLTNHQGKNTTVKLGNESKPGILFQSLRAIVVDASPRFVEVTKNGEEYYTTQKALKDSGQQYDPMALRLGRVGSLVDIYCNYDGSYNSANGAPYTGAELHNAMKEVSDKDMTALRTFYLVYLFSDTNELLHANPIVLSLKGLAASAFGGAVESFGKGVLSAISSLGNTKLSQARMTLDGLRSFYFICELEGATAGNNNNWITQVKLNEQGQPMVGADYIEDDAITEMVSNCAELSDGFAWKYAKQVEEDCGIHAISGTLGNANALPAAIDVAVSEPLPF